MNHRDKYDAIIIGGSYSGLSAALSLGRALKKTLVIDSGKPCNRQTPHSHNFLTQDGTTPSEISLIAKEQVEKYESVSFLNGFAIKAKKTDLGFEVTTESGDLLLAKKLIIATGIKDLMPEIKGFAECWGISVIHCPYCHGYEVRNEKTGLLANGDFAFEFPKMLLNWTSDLTIFTNGKSTLTDEQTNKLIARGIKICEKEIAEFSHTNGKLDKLVFTDGSNEELKAIYAHVPFEHTSAIAENLGCELTEAGHIKVDDFQQTSVSGVYACGDSTTMMRSVAKAVGSGSFAGAMLSKDLIIEEF